METSESVMRQDSTDGIRQRTSAACDACRARKVKCILPNGHSICSICAELGIACTRNQPRKKRGPKNRYIQALRSRLDHTCEDNLSLPASVNELPPSLDLIGPRPALEQIIRDWFDWIHPVAPLLHPRLFLNRIARDHEQRRSEPSFVILVASISAATIASIRRRRSLYGGVTVESCFDLAERLGLWCRTNTISLEWTTAMYNFSSAACMEYGMDSTLSLRLAAEATIGLRHQIYHALDHYSFIDQQLFKRVYWLMFAGVCTSDIYGRPMLSLHASHESIQPLIPLEVSDDELLHGYSTSPDTYLSSPDTSEGLALPHPKSYVPGLNALARLFIVWQSSQAVPHKTMHHLQEHIDRAQQVLDSLPPELTWKGHPSSPDCGSVQDSGDFGTDVQTVNLKVTQLHIRANLLEQMNAIARSENLLTTPCIIIEERRRVVDDLLDILYHMPKEIFDANGYSIIPKVRDIGSALLDEIRTGDRTQGVHSQASVNLERLLAKLNDLDVIPLDLNSPETLTTT